MKLLKKIHGKIHNIWIKFFNKFFVNPYYKKNRKKLKNSSFTILSSTCIAGYIYNRLGQRFDSPTINTWISQPDFCKFCNDLDYYLNCELVFYKKEGRTCPCAYLGQNNKKISVDFVHYETEKIAREKWEERKKRIHYDNIYIINSDGNGCTKKDFDLLDKVKCQRKIILTTRENKEIKNSFSLNEMKNLPDASTHMICIDKITGMRKWEFEFDYVSWLNNEEKFRQNKKTCIMKILRLKK